jgi:1-acyl-sn-glycerol-3-phosphate acyltransferase
MLVHVLQGVATTLFVFPLVSDAGRRTLVKRWSIRLLRILRVDVRIDGDIGVHRGNVMVVANHISWLAIFVISAAHPVRFVAKAEIAKWPVLAQMARGAGTVFIERQRPRDVLNVNHKMAQLLAQAMSSRFPEGTPRSAWRAAAVWARCCSRSSRRKVMSAGGHSIPDAGRRSLRAPAYVGDTSFVESFWCVCGERALTVELVARPALPARDRHRRDLARLAEASIRPALVGLASAREPDTDSGPGTGRR